VQIPVANTLGETMKFLSFPDFSQWTNPAIYLAAVTIAIVASLETLLNLEAVDKLDRQRRYSPPSRELVAQGCGNMLAGLIGGMPMTSVIVRSSVNVNSGGATKLSAIFHGLLLLVSVMLFPAYLNMIPLASLAAILLVTGFKLASPKLFRQMWNEGRNQFIPFVATLVSIVFTDLLIGILIGLGVSLLFILHSNLRRPVRRIVETHLGHDLLHIELANQVSFLNRAALDKVFQQARPGTQVLIDATDTDYIDPDVLSMILDFRDCVGPAHGVTVSLRGFRDRYQIHDEVEFADYSTRELKERVTPAQVLDFLREGNRRFHTGHRLSRDFRQQVIATAEGQNPLAVVLSCIDSRVPAELVFDLGIGDIFSVRVAGNVVGEQQLASIEYGVRVVGVKLIVVLGHTRCGAVISSVELLGRGEDVARATGCDHLHSIVDEIEQCVAKDECRRWKELDEQARDSFIDSIVQRNVLRTVDEIIARSNAVKEAIHAGQLMVVGAVYDVKTGNIDFMVDQARPASALSLQQE
jgi:carbonic anhydrase/SulP family sulfate permease